MSRPETPSHIRFWPKVNKSAMAASACWEWTGSKDRRNYGQFRHNGKTCAAHRVAYELSCGPGPDGMDVLHSCDNPPCVNPAHLSIGTHARNMREMADRDRNAGSVGESQHASVINEDDVAEMRTCYASGDWSIRELAEKFGISFAPARMAIYGLAWRRVTSVAPCKPRRNYETRATRGPITKCYDFSPAGPA